MLDSGFTHLSGVLHDLSYQLLKSSLPAPHLPDKGEASSHVVIAYYSQQIITLILVLSCGKHLEIIHYH